MEVKKLNIWHDDKQALRNLYADTVENLIKRNTTGSITYHMVDGVIKGYEFTFFGRDLQKIKDFY